MTAKRKPKKAALVLTDDDRAVLSSLPDDKRAMVEDMMRRRLCAKLVQRSVREDRRAEWWSTGPLPRLLHQDF
jgi:hypothetical protein